MNDLLKIVSNNRTKLTVGQNYVIIHTNNCVKNKMEKMFLFVAPKRIEKLLLSVHILGLMKILLLLIALSEIATSSYVGNSVHTMFEI